MLTASRRRHIEQVPCLLIGLLCDSGKLVRPPEPVEGGRGYREPSIDDYNALTWLVQWDGDRVDRHGLRKASGAIGYHDRYDFHTASDVREIVFLTGSPRAVHDLLKIVVDNSDRRVMGMVGADNPRLSKMLDAMGFKVTRTLFEETE